MRQGRGTRLSRVHVSADAASDLGRDMSARTRTSNATSQRPSLARHTAGLCPPSRSTSSAGMRREL